MLKILNTPLIEQLLYSAHNFIFVIFCARNLTNHEYGLITTLLLYSMITTSLMLSITFTPMVRLITLSQEPNKYRNLVNLFVYLFILIAAVFIGYHLYGKDYNFSEIFISILFVLSKTVYEFARKIYLLDNKIIIATTAVIVMIIFILILVFSFTFSAYTIISIYVLFFCVFSFSAIVFHPKVGVSRLFEHIHESKWLLATAFLQVFSANYFLLTLASKPSGEIYLSFYRSLQNVMNVFNPFLSYFDNSMYIKGMRIYAKKSNNKVLVSFLYKSFIQLTILFFPFLLGIYLYSYELLDFIYNKEVAMYSYLMIFFCIGIVFSVFGTIFMTYLKVVGATKFIFYGYLITFLFSTISAPVWINSLGIYGATIGVLITQIIFVTFLFCNIYFKDLICES